MKEINLFIHRRDLRCEDNRGLYLLSDKYPEIPIMHIFVFNPIQIDPSINSYYNNNCVQFMIEALKDLRETLKGALYFFSGTDADVLDSLIIKYRINAIGWNADHTPFARKRDEALQKWCDAKNVDTVVGQDYLLFDAGTVLTGGRTPYLVYTPFYNKCLAITGNILEPLGSSKTLVFARGKSSIKNIDVYYTYNKNAKVRAGRALALSILSGNEFKNYDVQRDFPALDKTTKLGAYIKFGCISIREAYTAFRKAYGIRHGLVRELLWREFYAHLVWHFPALLNGSAHKPEKFTWISNPEWYDAIMQARTGFHLIDAALNELKTTGWINNRLRMIVASFITKDLAMDWRIFERDLFGRYLIDYDPATNCLSWQGSASVGVDATPYWRIMNPHLQMKKYDKDCAYVRKWLKLDHMTNSEILNDRSGIVDHDEQVKKYLALWT